jgi:hypothetical protein
LTGAKVVRPCRHSLSDSTHIILDGKDEQQKRRAFPVYFVGGEWLVKAETFLQWLRTVIDSAWGWVSPGLEERSEIRRYE